MVPLDLREQSFGRCSVDLPTRACSLSDEPAEEIFESGFVAGDEFVGAGSRIDGRGTMSIESEFAVEDMIGVVEEAISSTK